MRWGDAPYVRLYVEPDADFLALSWQSRALFYELLKCADRTGCVKTGRRVTAGVAVLTRIPEPVVAEALPGLLEDGCVVETTSGLVIRNFLEAQTTPRSDAARKREERARHRDTELSHELSRSVTKNHTITEQSRAEQNRTDTPSPRRADARGGEIAADFDARFWQPYPAARRHAKADCLALWRALSESDRDACAAGLSRWRTSEQWQDATKIVWPERFLKRRDWESDPPQARRTASSCDDPRFAALVAANPELA